MTTSAILPASDREMSLTRDMAAPREAVYAAWTRRLPEWWGPHGTMTPEYEIDLRPGGVFRTVMRAADGSEFTTRGVFLDVVPNERLVFTDAFEPGWIPHPHIFFTAHFTFAALEGAATRCTARAVHWTPANRREHERMGFRHCWGESLDRLESIVTKR